MTNILLITSSPRGAASYSTRVAWRVVDELRRVRPDAELAIRDLAKAPLQHIDEHFATGRAGPTDQFAAEERSSLALSDVLIDELLAADIVVIAVPMINFSVPSPLKAWIDHVARPGRTFRYTANGPEPLVTGKRAILVEAKGGIYSEGPRRKFDHLTPFMLDVLGFLGITDVKLIRIEGTAISPESGARALESGLKQAVEVAREIAAEMEVPLVPETETGGLNALVSF